MDGWTRLLESKSFVIAWRLLLSDSFLPNKDMYRVTLVASGTNLGFTVVSAPLTHSSSGVIVAPVAAACADLFVAGVVSWSKEWTWLCRLNPGDDLRCEQQLQNVDIWREESENQLSIRKSELAITISFLRLMALFTLLYVQDGKWGSGWMSPNLGALIPRLLACANNCLCMQI